MPWLTLAPEALETPPSHEVLDELFRQPGPHKIMPFSEALQLAAERGLLSAGIEKEFPNIAVDDV